MYRFTDKITFAGLNSFKDFQTTIKKVEVGEAEQVQNRQTVPFMNGSYDFSRISGNAIYQDREVKVTFNIIGIDYAEIYAKKIELEKWLRSAYNSVLYIDSIEIYHFKNATCTKTNFNVISKRNTVAELEATFTVYPFLVSANYSAQLWDEFDFRAC